MTICTRSYLFSFPSSYKNLIIKKSVEQAVRKNKYPSKLFGNNVIPPPHIVYKVQDKMLLKKSACPKLFEINRLQFNVTIPSYVQINLCR